MDTTERPNRIPWPPIFYAAAFVLGLALAQVKPLAVPIRPEVGWTILACGILLDLWAMWTLHSHQANILPHRAATRLVTTGAYWLSRNPIYVGNTLLLLGLAIVLHNAWLIITAFMALTLVDGYAVKREEEHLLAKFGNDWRAYMDRTPRYLLI